MPPTTIEQNSRQNVDAPARGSTNSGLISFEQHSAEDVTIGGEILELSDAKEDSQRGARTKSKSHLEKEKK
jgi:hypothetical protein